MTKQKSISALPSTVRYPIGIEIPLSSLKTKERATIQRDICRSAGRKLSDYYSNNLNEWETFVNIMSDSK